MARSPHIYFSLELADPHFPEHVWSALDLKLLLDLEIPNDLPVVARHLNRHSCEDMIEAVCSNIPELQPYAYVSGRLPIVPVGRH